MGRCLRSLSRGLFGFRSALRSSGSWRSSSTTSPAEAGVWEMISHRPRGRLVEEQLDSEELRTLSRSLSFKPRSGCAGRADQEWPACGTHAQQAALHAVALRQLALLAAGVEFDDPKWFHNYCKAWSLYCQHYGAGVWLGPRLPKRSLIDA